MEKLFDRVIVCRFKEISQPVYQIKVIRKGVNRIYIDVKNQFNARLTSNIVEVSWFHPFCFP